MNFNVPQPQRSSAGVYRLVCYATGDAYIGSTSNFSDRYQQHIHAAGHKDNPTYRRIKAIGLEHFYFEVIEPFGVNDTQCMMAFERGMIAAFRPSLNINTGVNRSEKRSSIKYGFTITAEEREIINKVVQAKKIAWFMKSCKISHYTFEKLRHNGTGSEDCIRNVRRFIKSNAKLGKLINEMRFISTPNALVSKGKKEIQK